MFIFSGKNYVWSIEKIAISEEQIKLDEISEISSSAKEKVDNYKNKRNDLLKKWGEEPKIEIDIKKAFNDYYAAKILLKPFGFHYTIPEFREINIYLTKAGL